MRGGFFGGWGSDARAKPRKEMKELDIGRRHEAQLLVGNNSCII
jgi:hypothetical protein